MISSLERSPSAYETGAYAVMKKMAERIKELEKECSEHRITIAKITDELQALKESMNGSGISSH